MKSHGCALGSLFGTAPQLVGRAWWLCRHSFCSVDFATTCLGFLYEVKKDWCGYHARPSVTCQQLNCLSDFMEVDIGALYSRAGVRRNGLRERHTVLNGVNEFEPVHSIYILPIWVKLPRPAEVLNALSLYIYEFHEIWLSKLILQRVHVIFPRALHFLLICIKVGTRQAYKNVLNENRCSKICRFGA